MTNKDREDIKAALGEVEGELIMAMKKFGPMKSQHEGYAVILEELDEMWQEIKHGTKEKAIRECLQVAAMAVRFLIDLGNENE